VGVRPLFALGDVLLDERDAPVGGVEWVRKLAQSLIGEASNLRNRFRTKAITLHKPARGVSAAGGEFPVAVVAGFCERFGVGVALDGDFIRQITQFLRQHDQVAIGTFG